MYFFKPWRIVSLDDVIFVSLLFSSTIDKILNLIYNFNGSNNKKLTPVFLVTLLWNCTEYKQWLHNFSIIRSANEDVGYKLNLVKLNNSILLYRHITLLKLCNIMVAHSKSSMLTIPKPTTEHNSEQVPPTSYFQNPLGWIHLTFNRTSPKMVLHYITFSDFNWNVQHTGYSVVQNTFAVMDGTVQLNEPT